MIRKVSGGYKVYSEKGKPLSKTYHTKQQAQQRLNQIEYYKSKNKGIEICSFLYLGHEYLLNYLLKCSKMLILLHKR